MELATLDLQSVQTNVPEKCNSMSFEARDKLFALTFVRFLRAVKYDYRMKLLLEYAEALRLIAKDCPMGSEGTVESVNKLLDLIAPEIKAKFDALNQYK